MKKFILKLFKISTFIVFIVFSYYLLNIILYLIDNSSFYTQKICITIIIFIVFTSSLIYIFNTIERYAYTSNPKNTDVIAFFLQCLIVITLGYF